MIVDKPLSVGHFGEKKQTCVIYTVHVHPNGSRFATGGSDHRVRIWSMEPFRSPAAAVTTPPPPPSGDVQLLANLPQHTGSVLCVRWSHDGRYLASASDDTYLLVWELLPAGLAAAAPFGSSETPNVEKWSRVCVLRGHVSDVLDCAWSPDDSMLVSSSIDNKVIVWRLPVVVDEGRGVASSTSTAKILNPFMTLEGHKSFVKGVAWDPVGRFIASIGADNRLLIWRVGGKWDVEATISKPFEECDDTLVRRLSWSSDGQFLVATNSKDGDTHNAVVMQRGRWNDQPTFLVGFSQSTLSASFSPTIYKPKPTESSAATASGGGAALGGTGKKRPAVHHVVAVAGQDNVITVWLAAAARPVVVLKEVFSQPPSDLSWGADGYTLVVSGYDGTVVVLRFTPEELGVVLPEADRQAHFVKIYGKDAANGGISALALDGAPYLVDNPRQLALERARKEQQKGHVAAAAAARAQAQANRGAAAVQFGRSPAPGVSEARPFQIESRGKDGKRRIQPTLLNSGGGTTMQSLTVAVPSPPGGEATEGFGSAAAAASGAGSPRSGFKRQRTGGGGGSRSCQQVVGVRSWESTVVRLKSPRGMPMVSPPELMPRKSSTGSLIRQITDRGGRGGGAFRPPPRLRQAPAPGSSEGKAGAGSGSGLGRQGDSGGEDVGVAVLECSALEEDYRGLPARLYTLVAVTRGGREAWRDYVAGMATACCGNGRMVAVGAEDGTVYVYDRNGVRSAPPLVISPPVAYLECSDQRPPPQPQHQPPAAAGRSGEHLMAISGDGEVTVWNLGSMTLAVKTSLAPLFRSVSSCSPPSTSISARSSAGTATAAAAPATSASGPGFPGGASSSSRKDGASTPGCAGAKKGVSVTRAGVTPEGMPLVMLACQGAFGGSLQAFTFHAGLGTWVRVADGRFALSDFYSSGPCTSPSAREGVLSALQAGVRAGSSPTPSALLQASRTGARPAAAGGATGETLQSAVTRAHLEDSLSTAVMLGSAEEFVDVLRAYAGHLAKSSGLGHGRIRALCDKLLLESSATEDRRHFETGEGPQAIWRGKGQLLGFRLCDGPSVLGLDKLHLLKEVVLPALSGNRSLQRLVSEYNDALELISDRAPHGFPRSPLDLLVAHGAASDMAPPAGASNSSNGGSSVARAGSGSSAPTANGGSSTAVGAGLNSGSTVANGGGGVAAAAGGTVGAPAAKAASRADEGIGAPAAGSGTGKHGEVDSSAATAGSR